MAVSEVQVGDKVWFNSRVTKSGNLVPDGRMILCQGSVLAVGPKSIVADGGDIQWGVPFENLIAIDGRAPSKPPEPKPPTHPEIVDAWWAGVWVGAYAGVVAGSFSTPVILWLIRYIGAL